MESVKLLNTIPKSSGRAVEERHELKVFECRRHSLVVRTHVTVDFSHDMGSDPVNSHVFGPLPDINLSRSYQMLFLFKRIKFCRTVHSKFKCSEEQHESSKNFSLENLTL